MKGELAAVASQYAEAALELSIEDDKVNGRQIGSGSITERVRADLLTIKEVFALTPELRLVLNHPAVGAEEKTNLLMSTFEGKVCDLTLRLLNLLSTRRRLNVIDLVEEEFTKLLKAKLNIVSARLYCAESLNANEMADIKARLVEHLGKRLDLDVEVDKSLIGGVVLKIGDQVIDGSLKGKLQEIEKELCSV